MNDLEEYFESNEGRLIHKWMHYFEVYDRHFRRFRGRAPVVLEIGVSQGGSLQMWKRYFGDGARIYGIDIDPRCKEFEEKGIEIFIGSQSDREFLRRVRASIPPIDILIDDGGHTMIQQITTFEELFGAVKKDGVYLCEDVHTSYWIRFGGGHHRRGTFIEYSKKLVDKLNAWHSEQSSLVVDDFTRSADSIHFYDSIVVIEKQERVPPEHRHTGTPGLAKSPNPALMKRIMNGVKRPLARVLRWLGAPNPIGR